MPTANEVANGRRAPRSETRLSPPGNSEMTRGSTADHGQRRRVVVEQLLSDIFAGRLAAGTRLVIRALSDRCGVSPTPVREALVELEGIGIIEFIPNCGGVVRRMTRNDVEDLCQVRQALECEAARSACGRVYISSLHDLAGEFAKMKATRRHGPSFVERARRLDSQLHDLIAQSCGNRFLVRELERLKILFRAMRDASWNKRLAAHDYYRFAEEAAEHQAIVTALLANDQERATQAMAQHIQAGVKYWIGGLPLDS